MTLICGWLPNEPGADAASVVRTMGRALRVHAGLEWGSWSAPSLTVGLLELPDKERVQTEYAPAVRGDNHYYLWMAGEAFAGGGLIAVRDVTQTRTLVFRQLLLDTVLAHGVDPIRDLDGHYTIVLWDAHREVLTLLNDRFGNLPLYWSRSRDGFAFSSGVRGVLMAPGVQATPDPEALREAVTFGGFRLSDRTNIATVKMLPGAAHVTVRDGCPSLRRYWRWADIRPLPSCPLPTLIEEAHSLWQAAVGRRIRGIARAGGTLSGGLDSRAILAEGAPRVSRWTAVTYGVPSCDDARYAQRAAATVGASWVFHPLYSGRNPGWLERRTSQIQPTDGLLQLVDLMHLEALPLMADVLEVNLPGIYGDPVCGPTYHSVKDAETLVAQLPYYWSSIGWSWEDALAWARQTIIDLDGARPRYGIYEHKFPQSVNRIFHAYAPWMRMRMPFADYQLFEFFAGRELEQRPDLYPRMLMAKYRCSFSSIPHQKTGMPILTPSWRVQIERTRRFAWRRVQPALAAFGLPAQPRLRSYHNDELFWRTAENRQRIEATILRPGSLSCDILGHDRVAAVVTDWFDRAAAPAQVIGALYVFEAYHQGLPGVLRAALRSAAECSHE